MGCQKPAVLIVDDEQAVCELLHAELSERGYRCSTALGGNEALTKLAAQKFDIALLDIRLPEMSGMELLRRICLKHRRVTAIMITGINNTDTAVEAIKLGASDYLIKPLDLGRLSESIQTALESKRCPVNKGGHKTTVSVGSQKDEGQAVAEPINKIQAIARGVEARLDLLDDHSRIVTQRTAKVARELGIDESEIQRWLVTRARLDSEKKRQNKSSLNKLRLSAFAQVIMGMTKLHRLTRGFIESQN